VGRACSPNGGKEKCVWPIGGKARGRPRRGWVNSIEMDLGDIERGAVDWVGLAQDRNERRALVSAATNL
jgi:hypothetical protein